MKLSPASWSVAASVPTAIIGLAFKDELEAAFGKPEFIGISLLITGTLLLVTSRQSGARLGWRQFTFAAAIVVGLAQGLAIMPGISRSGVTIVVALLLGLNRGLPSFHFYFQYPLLLEPRVWKRQNPRVILIGI